MATDKNWSPRRSNPRVPFVTAVLPEAAAAARDLGEIVDRLDAHDVFGHLVAKLALDPHSQGRSVLDLERRVVHLVSEDRLRMKRVDEPDRLVIAAGVVERLFERVGAEQGDIARLWLEPRSRQHRRQLRALPLADAAPALDAIVAGDLRARGQGAQVGERELYRPLDKAADFQFPVLKPALAQRDIGGILRIDRAVRFEIGGDRAGRKFGRHGRFWPEERAL